MSTCAGEGGSQVISHQIAVVFLGPRAVNACVSSWKDLNCVSTFNFAQSAI